MEVMAEKDVSRLLEMRTKFRLDVLKFIKKHKASDPSIEETWNGHIKEVVDKVIEYKNEVAIKISSLSTLSAYESKMLALEKEKFEFQKQQALQQSKDRETEAQRLKEEGQAKATTKLKSFRVDYDSLVSIMNEDFSDVKNMLDQEVCDEMQKLSKIEKVVDRIVTNFFEYEHLVTIHGE